MKLMMSEAPCRQYSICGSVNDSRHPWFPSADVVGLEIDVCRWASDDVTLEVDARLESTVVFSLTELDLERVLFSFIFLTRSMSKVEKIFVLNGSVREVFHGE
jgi:hypothetical protein